MGREAMRLFCLAIVLAASGASAFRPSDHDGDAAVAGFTAWKKQHKKSYDNAEHEAAAFRTYRTNLALVSAHNARYHAGLSTYYLGMNQFADLSNDQYRQMMLRPRGNMPASSRSSATGVFVASPASAAALPTSFNWVDHGIVPLPKDQGQCGSCWAFSAVAAMEAAYNKANNGSISAACAGTVCGKGNNSCCSFSEQFVADCTNGGADTCDIGGEMHDGVMAVVKHSQGALSTESQYPYTSGKTGKLSACRDSVPGAVATGITGYTNVSSGDESALAQATFEHGVISVGIDASSFAFQLYAGGIYTDESCGNTMKKLDHGVAVVGFGVGDPTPPGPAPPPPGPANCDKNHYKIPCQGEHGCFWCTDKSGFGWCQNEPCNGVKTAVGDGKEFWMVRNSWGRSWGMNGYIAMARNRKNMCGIATDAIFVNL